MSKDKNITDQIKEINKLKALRDNAQSKVTADEAELRVLEEQRDELYAECQGLGVEPQDIKSEIARKTEALQQDIDRINNRFKDLTESSIMDEG